MFYIMPSTTTCPQPCSSLHRIKSGFAVCQKRVSGIPGIDQLFSQTLAVNDETSKFKIWDIAGQQRIRLHALKSGSKKFKNKLSRMQRPGPRPF